MTRRAILKTLCGVAFLTVGTFVWLMPQPPAWSDVVHLANGATSRACNPETPVLGWA